MSRITNRADGAALSATEKRRRRYARLILPAAESGIAGVTAAMALLELSIEMDALGERWEDIEPALE
jgi:hypothetical protein